MLEIAQNYASALLSLAVDDNKVILYQEEVKELRKIIRDNPDFLLLIESRFLSVKEREENAEKLLSNFSTDVVNFIKIIIKHNRVNYLVDILAQNCKEIFTVSDTYCRFCPFIIYQNIISADRRCF